MSKEKTIKGEICERYIRKYPRSSTKTIARILHEENSDLFPTLENARSVVRYHTGALGKKNLNNLKDKSMVRDKDFKVEMPKSEYEEWYPYIIKVTEGLRVAILGDIHLPYYLEPVMDATLDYLDTYKPEVILLNGDVADVYPLSIFQKDPKKRDLHNEMSITAQFLKHLQARFKCDIYYKLANHEERWDKYFWSHPDFCDMEFVKFINVLEKEFGVKGIKWVTDQRIVQLGKLPVVHGHEWQRSFNNPVNPARGAFLKTFSDILVSHLHRTSQHTEQTLDGRRIRTRSIGCLCGLHPEFARLNNWECSFATVDMKKAGKYKLDLLDVFYDLKTNLAEIVS